MRSIRNGKVRYAAVAHLVERHLAKVEVASSSLVSRSTFSSQNRICGCSSSGRAPPCQGGGSEFEPRQPLQRKGTELIGAFVLSEGVAMVQRFVWYSTRRAGCPHPAACKPVRLANVSPFLRSDAGGEGLRPRRAGKLHAAACRDAPLRRRGAKGDRTPRFPVPSCDSPTFLWPRLPSVARLKSGGRSAARSVLGFLQTFKEGVCRFLHLMGFCVLGLAGDCGRARFRLLL